jgi:hypothetical protein
MASLYFPVITDDDFMEGLKLEASFVIQKLAL